MNESELFPMPADVATPRERKKAAEANALKLLPKLIEAANWGQKDSVEKIGREVAQHSRHC